MSAVSVTSPPSTRTLPASPGILERFHPAVRTWFERRFPDGPTEAQAGGWPEVVSGRHTLICAPTGSGKTLAGFLAAIDALYHAHEAGEDIEGFTRVVYLSPLKALAVDVHTNLEEPLGTLVFDRRLPLAQRQRGRAHTPRRPQPCRSPRSRGAELVARVPRRQAPARAVAPSSWTSCSPSANSSTIFAQKAGRSSGLRLDTRPWSVTTSSSTTLPPALRMSVRIEG